MANPTKVTVSGLTPVAVAAGAAAASTGDVVAANPTATYLFVVVNGGGVSDTVKLNDSVSVGPDGATAFDADSSHVVPNGATRAFWVRDVRRFRNPSTGNIELVHSSIASVTVTVYELL